MPKVLLIEDDPLVVRMYQKILTFEGFQVESAPDGREGVMKAKEVKPDLIFCDVMMPKMNGIEVLELLKSDAETKEIPVIMLTNLSGTHDAELALQKGAFAYMVKSEYRPKEVAAKAKELIAGLKLTPSAPQVSGE
ncbi:MAG TPA: response regulator [Patescibacteria group bacterium]|nr:response regulator [Patescibacteria group bacterium]